MSAEIVSSRASSGTLHKPKRTLASTVSRSVGVAALALVLLWVLIFARGTSAEPAIRNPGEFLVTLLDGLTLAGLLFVVASGFTLIFGLMRTVNMAHGSLFLLSAYVAIDVQQKMVGKARNIEASDVNIASWVLPLFAGAFLAAVVGLFTHFIFLRWNQGQDLRQALLTIGISVILADQMLARFGGLAQKMSWPGAVTHFIKIFGRRYAVSRLFMLALAIVLGFALWFWLNRTRMGMVIRAGVDDQPMVRALGINISLVLAVTFFVGAFLAGIGGVMGASFAGAATGVDGQWLLNSLVVVIIGGLGSIKGAVAGSLLYGIVVSFAASYLPSDYTFYSIILTFALLALVLSVRPQGLFGKAP